MKYRLFLYVGLLAALLSVGGCGSGGGGGGDNPPPAAVRFFGANDGVNGVELWKTDGTEPGTMMVKNINDTALGAGSGPNNIAVLNGALSFFASDGVNGFELWKSDGTPSGTVMVKNICPEACSGFLD